MTDNPHEGTLFQLTCDMEDSLMEIKDFSFALMLLAGSLTNDAGRAVNRLASAINDSACEAERLRAEVFRFTHPNGATREDGE